MKSCKVSIVDIQILRELNNVDGGLKAESIIKLTQLKGRTVYYHLEKLVNGEIVFHDNPYYKIAKSFRESQDFAKLLVKQERFLLCNLSFVIRLIKKPDWWNRRENALRRVFPKAEVKRVNLMNNSYFQVKDFKYYIQTFNDSIIFISRTKFAGRDAYECFISAVNEFIEVYTIFEEKMKFRFFEDSIPNVSVRTQNYVRLRDAIAEHCKRTGDKFEVWIDNKRVLFVDASDPTGMESDDKNSALDQLMIYHEYVADIEKKLPPKLSELSNAIVQTNTNVNNLVLGFDNYGKHIQSHISAIQELGLGIRELTTLIKRLDKANMPPT